MELFRCIDDLNEDESRGKSEVDFVYFYASM